MEYAAKAVLKALLLPPGLFFAMNLVGLWLVFRPTKNTRPRRLIAATLLIGSLILFYLSSTGYVASYLGQFLERDSVPLNEEAERRAAYGKAQAIVILAGGTRNNALENATEYALNWRTLERVNYGARLAKESRLPILVSGGILPFNRVGEGQTMAEALRKDYGLEVRWIESKSINTEQNAQFSAQLLSQHGISHIILVTHASHMPRSQLEFTLAGFTVIAAPMSFSQTVTDSPFMSWVPNAHAIGRNFDLLHEIVGMFWTKFRALI